MVKLEAVGHVARSALRRWRRILLADIIQTVAAGALGVRKALNYPEAHGQWLGVTAILAGKRDRM